MKNKVKTFLARNNIFSTVDLIRRLPQTSRWIKGGCRGVAPPPIKRMVIKSYLKDYQLKRFVETGTHLGDTLADVACNKNIQTISIELADNYYQNAKQRFSNYSNVTLFHGDSGQLMPQVVKSLDMSALFWLDGHYSGGETAKGEAETPISAELQAILKSSTNTHVILIDDIRCFNGSHDYPHLHEIMAAIQADGRYNVEVSADILRMTPKQF